MSKEDPYYQGAYRVIRDGVPCRVFIKGPAKGKKEIELAAGWGVELRFDDIPGFTFDPVQDRHQQLQRGTRYRASSQIPKPGPMAKEYYKGGVRLVIGGVPCKVFRVGQDRRHYRKWVNLSGAMLNNADRARKFRQELIDRGSFEAAGIRTYDL
jgi:hypothetical protein